MIDERLDKLLRQFLIFCLDIHYQVEGREFKTIQDAQKEYRSQIKALVIGEFGESLGKRHNKILSLTKAIRYYEENELCLGTLKTLKMIDDEAKAIITEMKEKFK